MSVGSKMFTFSLSGSAFEFMEIPLAPPSHRTTVLLFLAVAAGTLSGSAQQRTDFPSSPSLIDPKLETTTLANVGPLTISGIEFKLGYEFGPAFVKREKNSKERYLNFLIYEKLLALDARDRGLDQWTDVKSQVEEIEGDLASEELYKDDVLSKVQVGERQLAFGVQHERVHTTLQWLFCSSAHEVDDVVKKMALGNTFDSLFAVQLRTGVKPEERSVETTRFKLRTHNPLFATVVDTMSSGTVSLPIHGPDGWYIVKVADVWINPIVTETEETKLREDVKRALTQRIADSLSDTYVHAMIIAQQPTILREPFNAVVAFLGGKFLSKEKRKEWNLEGRKGAQELTDCSNLEPIAGRTLVQLSKNGLGVRDFLQWFRMREPYIKLALVSQQAFFASAEELVWRMVRDRLLSRKAFERGLQKRTSVERQTEWWREKMLYAANKRRIADTITDSLPAIRKYYDDNARSFFDENGTRKPFESVREDVWREYYSYELTKRLLHEILRLKRRYAVKLDKSALENIRVADEHEPRAIDVYAVKKGGIYPRTAFPSIDYDWQSWN